MRLKKIGKETIIYGIGKGLNFLLGFFFIPLLVTVLSAEEYGQVELLSTIGIVIGYILTAGMDTTQSYLFYKSETGDVSKDRSRLVSSILSVKIISSVLLLVVFLIILTIFNNIPFLIILSLPMLILILAYSCSSQIIAQLTEVLRFNFKPFGYSAVNFLYTFGTLTTAYILIFNVDLGVHGYFLGFFLGSIPALILSVLKNRKYLVWKSLDLMYTKHLFKLSSPLLLNNVIIWVLDVSDKWSINYFLGTEQVGIYGIGHKISLGIMFFAIIFRTVWWPIAMKEINSSEIDKSMFQKVSQLYLGTGLILSICLNYFSTDIVLLLFPGKYGPGAEVVGLLSLSAVFYGYILLSQIGITKSENYRVLSFVEFVTIAVNIGLNFMLIPVIGIVGAAVSTTCCIILKNVINLIISEKRFSLNISLTRLLVQTLIGGIAIISNLILDNNLAITIISLFCILSLLVISVPFGFIKTIINKSFK